MSGTTDTHRGRKRDKSIRTDIGMKHEKLISRLFFSQCLLSSIRCETVTRRKEKRESNPDHYYMRARTQLIIDWAQGEEEEEGKEENTRESNQRFLSQRDVRSFQWRND